MKKFVIWLCKKYNLPTEKIVEKEVIKYVTDGTVQGDLHVDGNLIVKGKITLTKGIICLNKGDNNNGK